MARALPEGAASMQMKSRMSNVFPCAILLSLAIFAGCSTDRKADAAQPVERKEGSVAPRPVVVETPSQPYRPMTVSGGARLTGTVDFDGPMPADSIVPIPPDTQGCGQTANIRAVERTGTKIGEVVVWLADIRAGKPLPIERRFELANQGCMLSPRVQAVFAPATLNDSSGRAPPATFAPLRTGCSSPTSPCRTRKRRPPARRRGRGKRLAVLA